MQAWIVGLIVMGCTAYAVWALLPQAWRRSLAQRMAHGPWPAALRRRFAQMGEGAGCGGGCKGCAPSAPAAGAARSEQAMRFHPRPPSR